MRSLLSLIALNGLLLCYGDDDSAKWDYSKNPNFGPEGWQKSFPNCGGNHQSPIDLDRATVQISPDIPELYFHNYDGVKSNIPLLNNGKTVQLEPKKWGGASIADGGLPDEYDLLQIHFHWSQDNANGSEHTISGVHYPLEMHMVHLKRGLSFKKAIKQSDGIAVLGVVFKIGSDGSDGSALQEIFSHLGKIKIKKEKTMVPGVDLAKLLPSDRGQFYRYLGSLTTPPCSEAVTWTVFSQLLTVTQEQLKMLRQLRQNTTTVLEKNFRPVMPLNERVVHLRKRVESETSAGPDSAGLPVPMSLLLLLVPGSLLFL